jgi:hypothetical protein
MLHLYTSLEKWVEKTMNGSGRVDGFLFTDSCREQGTVIVLRPSETGERNESEKA